MHLNIRITGAAGAGVNSTVDIVAGLFAELGYDMITDIEYESRIKGGVNYFDIFISDKNEKFLTKYVDIVLAFNSESLEKAIPSLKAGAIIIINKKWSEKYSENVGNENFHSLQDFNILDLEISDKYDNTYLLGILAKYLNIDLNIILEKIEKVFARKGETVVKYNKAVIENIYKTYKIQNSVETSIYRVSEKDAINGHLYNIKKVGEPKTLAYGNESIAKGAIKSELEYFSAYPMTPASTVLTEVIKDGTVTFLQAEDEIAVANSAIGASFTGKRAMVATSGGGFALMTEALSFAVQAEFPIVAVLAQRAGPSTGTPTYQEQGDIHFALNPTFGDFEHIVMYPSNLEESYYFGGLSLNLADKYQNPVIVLTDKQAAEMHGTHSDFEACPVDRGVVLENPPEDYKRYELTESGISPRVNVGTKNGDFIATSYEHDEYGATTEDTILKQKFTEKRFKKLEDFYKKEGFSGYEIVNPKAKKMLVITGFTRYTAEHFIKNNPEFGLIIIKFLKPLDERLRAEIEKLEEVIFVESNYSGQIENYITKELGLKYIDGLKISNLRKYDLFPFYIEDFESLVK
ncbi:MAG: 2-oxoacid:acceptor oxidoreductase family protein [Candidatus Gracilibacteria bacterium]|nr:2-oxoacid:acceptor oxidoreductase family protein [Candidatus Gracilibacteria bacterium]MDQ7023242.1 2-oxoacid:acceptor oxidoreductase family protein [Candidatus Gracilibacteria bacterium]